MMDEQLKRNRIKNIENDNRPWYNFQWPGFWRKKAFIFPLAVIGSFALIGFGSWGIKKIFFDSAADSGDLGSKKMALSKNPLPELPAGNDDLDEGKAYYLKGWFPAAQSAFERVINSNAPDKHKSVALTYMGMIAYDQEQYVRAIDFLTRATKFNDKDPLIYRNLSLVYRKRQMYGQALKYAQQAKELAPENGKNFLLLGNIYLDMKEYSQAIKAYQKGLQFSTDDPLLLYNLGLAYMQQGDMPGAVNSFHLAAQKAQVGQVAIQSYTNLAYIYAARKDWEKAIEYQQSAVKQAPKNSKLLYELGNMYLRADKKKEALASYEKALLIGTPSRDLYEKLGDTYNQLQLYGEGIRAYSKALKQGGGKKIPILAKLAEMYYKQGDLKKAQEFNRQIIALNPGSNDARIAYMQIGNILSDVEQYDQAIDMFRKASELDPTDDKPWINMGNSFHAAKKYGNAISSYKKAILINPDNIKPRMALGTLYLDQGFYDEALVVFVRLLNMKPEFAPAHFQVAKLYHKRRRYDEAVSGYQKVIKLRPDGDQGKQLVYLSHLNMAQLMAQKPKLQDPLAMEHIFSQAISHAKTAIQMQANNAEGYFVLGEVYLARKETGDLQNAAERFRQVIAMGKVPDKLLSRTHNNLGKSFFLMGKYEQAIRHFSQALEYWPGNEQAALNRKTAALRYEKSLSQ